MATIDIIITDTLHPYILDRTLKTIKEQIAEL